MNCFEVNVYLNRNGPLLPRVAGSEGNRLHVAWVDFWSKGWSEGREWVSSRCSFQPGVSEGSNTGHNLSFKTELWFFVVGSHNFWSFGEIPTLSTTIQKHGVCFTMRSLKYPWLSYWNKWFLLGLGVVSKSTPYAMKTWSQTDPLNMTKVISWKNVSKMEDTKRSLAGHIDQRKKSARFLIGVGQNLRIVLSCFVS